MFESALESGLLASGVDILVGPLPTPAISHLVLSLDSRWRGYFASHNLMKIMGSNFLIV